MRFLRSSSTGMNATSTWPASSASVASPELGNSTCSTGTLSFLPSASARSAVTPRGLPSASLTTKKIDIDGANTSATRSFPVGISSFMALSFAAALPASSRAASIQSSGAFIGRLPRTRAITGLAMRGPAG